MDKKKLLLVSLEEEQAKRVAQVITNDTCRRILDALADKESTETDLAALLDVPLSTVHYNLQQLMKSGLVVSDEYHYSKRMKEINHYKLANQYIIIAPKSVDTKGLLSKLRSLLPVAIISVVGAMMIQFSSIMRSPFAASSKMIASEAAQNAIGQEMAKDSAAKAGETLAAAASAASSNATVLETAATGANAPSLMMDVTSNVNVCDAAQAAAPGPGFFASPAFWFLCGSLFVILLIIMIELFRRSKERRQD